MNRDQYPFEVVRDIATLLLQMSDGDAHEIRVNKHGQWIDFAMTNFGTPCGPAVAANLMGAAYNIVYSGPDKQQAIADFQSQLALMFKPEAVPRVANLAAFKEVDFIQDTSSEWSVYRNGAGNVGKLVQHPANKSWMFIGNGIPLSVDQMDLISHKAWELGQ